MSSRKYAAVWHALDRARVARQHAERVIANVRGEDVPLWASSGEEDAFLAALERLSAAWKLLPSQVQAVTGAIEVHAEHGRMVQAARALDERQRLGLAADDDVAAARRAGATSGMVVSGNQILLGGVLDMGAVRGGLTQLVAQLDFYLEMRLRVRDLVRQTLRHGGDLSRTMAERVRRAHDGDDEAVRAVLDRLAKLMTPGGVVLVGEPELAANQLEAELAALRRLDHDARGFESLIVLLRLLS